MNKYQEALDLIERSVYSERALYDLEEVEAIEELVKKATPKKVSFHKGYQGYRYTRYYCPTCGKTLENSWYPYCKHCGQAIKYPSFKKEDNKIVLDWGEDE